MSIKEQIFGEPGYSIDLALTSDELCFFQQAIEAQWFARLIELYSDLSDNYKVDSILNYHALPGIDHNTLWHKQYRLLSQNIVNSIKKFDFMDKLKADFGPFSISNVVFDNKVKDGEEIYWRLVRPGIANDVGPLHADKWFHNLAGDASYGMFPPNVTTVKIWIAIYTEPGLNGLLVVPNSHQKDWAYSVVEKNGQLKPEIQEDNESLNKVLVSTQPGSCLIFNEKLLHGGAINLGCQTRVSAEITMVLD